MHKKCVARCLMLLLAAAVQAVSGIGHAQPKPFSTEELTGLSEVVVVGRVTSLQSQWDNENTRIYTVVNIAVDEYLKGAQPQNEVAISVPGGEVGEVGEVYSHVARFHANEDVVVFASRDSRGVLRVTGGEQGKIPVTVDRQIGKSVVLENKTLDELKTQIRQAVQHRSQK